MIRVDAVRNCPARFLDSFRFKLLTGDEYSILAGALRRYPCEMSEYTLTNLVCWNNPERWIAVWNEHVLVGTVVGEWVCLLQPIGPDPGHIIRELSSEPGVYFDPVDASTLAISIPGWKHLPEREHFDYVYRRQDLVSLPGSAFKDHRKRINKFVNAFHPEVSILSGHTVAALKSVFDRWYQGRKLEDWLAREREAGELFFRNCSNWNLTGVAISTQREPIGFAIGEPLNESSFVVHFGKTVGSDGGAARFLVHEMAKTIPERFEFVNRMQDLGIPGLRTSKSEWIPVRMVEKYRFLPLALG